MVSNNDANQSEEPWLQVFGSRHFAQWLAHEQISLAVSAYQTGKLFLIGVNQDGQLAVFERTFNRVMGLWADADGQGFYLASEYQIWWLANVLAPASMHAEHDRLYVPRIGYTTGDLDIHDIGVDRQGRILFVATRFNCLGGLSDRDSFTPLWRPGFISKLSAEDRCHLNGMAMQNGDVRYVSAVSCSDVADGWRDRRHDGGVVIEVPTNRVVASGLSMPHSPRMHRDRLFVLNSGTGFLGSIDVVNGTFEPLAFCPGYLRGLALTDHYAVVGISKPRHDQTFGGLVLEKNLADRQAEPRCGLQIINLSTGDTEHWLRLEGMVTELYDVAILRGTLRPKMLGFKTDEIQRFITVAPPENLSS